MSVNCFKKLFEIMKNKSPLYAGLWKSSRQQFGDKWEQELSKNISAVFGDKYNEQWDEAINGYVSFCIDALRAQTYFEKNNSYKAKSYADCVEQCYHSPDYMKKRYLPGQYLSHYIWPHHQKMLQHFCNELLPKIKNDVSLFYEVGVGCGMYSQKTLENIPAAKGIGIDISNYSLEFTKRVAEVHGMGDRYEIYNKDVIKNPPSEKADFVISQEVLEHLEDPGTFIKALYNIAKDGAWGYITAAINAAHTDHIYLYRSPGEVRQQIEDAGWKVLDVQIEENYPEKPKEFRPTVAGFFVKK